MGSTAQLTPDSSRPRYGTTAQSQPSAARSAAPTSPTARTAALVCASQRQDPCTVPG